MHLNPKHPLAELFGSTEGTIKMLSLVLWKCRHANGGLAVKITKSDVMEFQRAMLLRGASAFVSVDGLDDGVRVAVCDENRGGMLIDLADVRPVEEQTPAANERYGNEKVE